MSFICPVFEHSNSFPNARALVHQTEPHLVEPGERGVLSGDICPGGRGVRQPGRDMHLVMAISLIRTWTTVPDLFWGVIYRGPVWDDTHPWTSVPVLLTKSPKPAIIRTYSFPELFSSYLD